MSIGDMAAEGILSLAAHVDSDQTWVTYLHWEIIVWDAFM